MNILLDYFFPITSIEPTAAASTAFLKQVCVVVKPAAEVETGVITLCTTMSAVAALTDNDEAQQLFNAGMNRVYILPMDDLDLADALEGHESDFFTLLISSDFSDADIEGEGSSPAVKASRKIQDITYTAKTAGVAGNNISITYADDGTGGAETVDVSGSAITVHIEPDVSVAQDIQDLINNDGDAGPLVAALVDVGDEQDVQQDTGTLNLTGGEDLVASAQALDVGAFKGVVGLASDDDTLNTARAATALRAAFHTTSTNKGRNMFYAFGKLLSNSLNWLNQQYITMPYADDVATLGDANAYFDDKVSFVISDTEFGKRLGLFAQGAKAIVAPYIKRNLEIDMQSAALTYISGNQPGYTKTAAALLEDELQKVIDSYVARQWIEVGTVSVLLEEDNFVASGYINIAEPKAMWRIFGEMRQTL